MLQILIAVTLGLSLMVSGCAALKASPSTGAGFVPMAQMAKQADLPFQKVWFKARRGFYSAIRASISRR